MVKYYKVVQPGGYSVLLGTQLEVRRFIDNNDTQFVVKFLSPEPFETLTKTWRYNRKYYPNSKRSYDSAYMTVPEAISRQLCNRCKSHCEEFADQRNARCAPCAAIFI